MGGTDLKQIIPQVTVIVEGAPRKKKKGQETYNGTGLLWIKDKLRRKSNILPVPSLSVPSMSLPCRVKSDNPCLVLCVSIGCLLLYSQVLTEETSANASTLLDILQREVCLIGGEWLSPLGNLPGQVGARHRDTGSLFSSCPPGPRALFKSQPRLVSAVLLVLPSRPLLSVSQRLQRGPV